MGRTTFTQDNIATQEGYPRLKLIRGEVALIVCLEDPWTEYVHHLECPVLVNGVPQMETKKRMDKSEYEAYVMEFLGNPICLGDEGILREKGKDPKNCVACKAADDSASVKPPKRRHAMHVVKYETRNGQPVEPFSMRVVVWSFTENIFAQLVTIASMHSDSGGLPKHDLVLGPPEEPVDFQKFNIVPSPKAVWLMGGVERRDLVLKTFQNKDNRAPDLADPFCGKRKNREWIDEALAKIKARWNIVNGVSGTGVRNSDMSVALDAGTLSEGLDELLNMNAPANASLSSPKSSMEELLSAGLESKEEKKKEEKKPPGESIAGFEDLLESLGN